MTGKKIRGYYICYSIAFALTACLVYILFIRYGKSFVYNGDGISQHVRAMDYYGKWLRKIAATLLREHRLVIPQWDFSIGYGAGVLPTFHYYVLGDPLMLLCAAVKGRGTVYLFCALVLIRNYLSGITFSCFCFYMKKENRLAVLAGAFTYVFCFYAIRKGIQHPFFLTPMMYLPLLLLGVEKILREKKPCLLIVSVFLAAISNFYFFYMAALLTAVYGAVRCFSLYGAKGFRQVLSIGLYALAGVLLSCFILVPVLTAMAGTYRVQNEYQIPWLYSAKFYKEFLGALAGPVRNEMTHIGVGAVTFPALYFLLFGKRRKSYPAVLKWLLLIGMIFMVFPIFGYILNGFAYVSNRWSWGFCFLLAFVLVTVWDDFFAVSVRDIIVLTVFTAAFTALYVKKGNMKITVCMLWVILLFLFGCLLFENRELLKSRKRLAETGLAALVILGLAGNSYSNFAKFGNNNLKSYLSADEVVKKHAQNPDARIAKLQKESGFNRFSGNGVQKNSAPVTGVNGMQFYWSIGNGNIERFFAKLGVRVQKYTYYYSGLDDRTMLGTMAGCRYYAVKKNGDVRVPYGFTLAEENKNYLYYENEQALPLAYTYSSYMTEEDTEGYNGVQLEHAMMEHVLLEEDVPGYEQSGEYTEDGQRLAFSVADDAQNDVELSEGAFLVKKKNGTLTLRIEGKNEGENYLGLTGFRFEGEASDSTVSVSGTDENGETWTKDLFYSKPDNTRPTLLHDYMINLGYHDAKLETITLTFAEKGRYTFSDLFAWHQPLDDYEALVAERGADAWQNEVIGTDYVSGQINLTEDKILLLAIPYDGGWSARVDGEEQELLQANIMFSALALKAGEHTVELTYTTPGLRLGVLLSLAGLVSLPAIVMYRRRKRPL